MSSNRGMIEEDAKMERSLPTAAEQAVVKEAAKATAKALAAAPTKKQQAFIANFNSALNAPWAAAERANYENAMKMGYPYVETASGYVVTPEEIENAKDLLSRTITLMSRVGGKKKKRTRRHKKKRGKKTRSYKRRRY